MIGVNSASHIPKQLATIATSLGFGSTIAEFKVAEEENAKLYFGLKTKIKEKLLEEKDKQKFSIQLCDYFKDAKDLISYIEEKSKLRPADETEPGYEEFKAILDNQDNNKKCGFSGGKFYKLKVKSKNKTRKSKKYKGKKFRKSKKRLAK